MKLVDDIVLAYSQSNKKSSLFVLQTDPSSMGVGYTKAERTRYWVWC